MNKFAKLLQRLRTRQYWYVAQVVGKLIFPQGNLIFYWDSFMLMKGVIARCIVDSTGYTIEYISHKIPHTRLLDELFVFDPHMTVLNKKRYAQGCIGAILKHQGNIVGYTWLYFADEYTTNCGMKVPSEGKYAWAYYIYVVPAYRMNGTFRVLMNAQKDLIDEAGYVGAVAETNVDNVIAMKSHARIGVKTIAKVSFISLFGFKLYFVKHLDSKKTSIDYRLWTYQVYEVR